MTTSEIVTVTRRMAIANGTCVSFCNQPIRHIIWLPHESRHAGMSLRVQAFGYVKSLRHILASHGYAPGTIAINFTWIERKFNACQTPHSMYPSICNRFPVIEPESSKVPHFSTFLHIFASPWYAPGTIAVNFTQLERGFNACKTPRCIYPSIFNRF